MNETSGDLREVTNTVSPEIVYIGEFDTLSDPFSIDVDEEGLLFLLRESLDLDEDDIRRLKLQFAATEVPLHEGVSHPISKLENRVAARLTEAASGERITGLTDTRTHGGKRVVTVFIGRIVEDFLAECRAATLKEIEEDEIEEETRMAVRFVKENLAGANEKDARLILEEVARYAVHLAVLNVVVHELRHFEQFNQSKASEVIDTLVMNYGLWILSPSIGGQVGLALAASDSLRLPYGIIGVMAGLVPPTIRQAYSFYRLILREHDAERYAEGQLKQIDEGWEPFVRVTLNKKILEEKGYFDKI